MGLADLEVGCGLEFFRPGRYSSRPVPHHVSLQAKGVDLATFGFPPTITGQMRKLSR